MNNHLDIIPLFKPNLPQRDKLQDALMDTIFEEPLNEGQLVYNFEEKLSQFLGVSDAIAVSSGTAALHLALIMSGVERDGHVISTSLTAEPTNTVIRSIGANITYCDLDPVSGLLDLNSLSVSDLERAKAFIVVHYGGYVQDLSAIQALCRKYSIKIIEDCAHALGSTLENENVGTIGDFGCFSFQAIKQITTIEGGAIVSKDPKTFPILRQLRWFGLQKSIPRSETNITMQGYKYNFNNVHAKIGLLQLSTYHTSLEKIVNRADAYTQETSRNPHFTNIPVLQKSQSSYWLFLSRVNSVDHASKFFADRRIVAGRVHKLNHHHEYLQADRDLFGCEEFEKTLFHIPIGAWMTENEVERVLAAIRDYTGI